MRKLVWVLLAVFAVGFVIVNAARAQNADEGKDKPPVVTPAENGEDKKYPSTEEYLNSGDDEDKKYDREVLVDFGDENMDEEGANESGDVPDDGDAEEPTQEQNPVEPLSDEELAREIAALKDEIAAAEKEVADAKAAIAVLPTRLLLSAKHRVQSVRTLARSAKGERLEALFEKYDAAGRAWQEGKTEELTEALERVGEYAEEQIKAVFEP